MDEKQIEIKNEAESIFSDLVSQAHDFSKYHKAENEINHREYITQEGREKLLDVEREKLREHIQRVGMSIEGKINHIVDVCTKMENYLEVDEKYTNLLTMLSATCESLPQNVIDAAWRPCIGYRMKLEGVCAVLISKGRSTEQIRKYMVDSEIWGKNLNEACYALESNAQESFGRMVALGNMVEKLCALMGVEINPFISHLDADDYSQWYTNELRKAFRC